MLYCLSLQYCRMGGCVREGRGFAVYMREGWGCTGFDKVEIRFQDIVGFVPLYIKTHLYRKLLCSLV